MFLLYSKMKREMKNFLLKWKKPLLWLTSFVLLVLCWQVWDGLFDAGLVLAAIVPGVSGGKIVSNEPLTTDIVREGSPSLLRSEVDKRIVKIRPMSTPIDQLSRWNGSRKASSMIVDYYSVDVKPTKSYMKASYVAPGASTVNDSHKKATINAVDNSIFEVSETLLVQGVKGYDPDGEMSNADLVLYIAAKDEDTGALTVYPINGSKIGSVTNCGAVYSREYAAYPYGACGNGTRCADGTIRRFTYQESEFLPDIQNADRAIDFPKNSE